MIGPDYIKIMTVIQEVESEYIKNLRNAESNGDARRYYLNGIQALREVKGKIKRNYEEKLHASHQFHLATIHHQLFEWKLPNILKIIKNRMKVTKSMNMNKKLLNFKKNNVNIVIIYLFP